MHLGGSLQFLDKSVSKKNSSTTTIVAKEKQMYHFRQRMNEAAVFHTLKKILYRAGEFVS